MDSALEVWSIVTDRPKSDRNEADMELDWMEAWQRMDAPKRERRGIAIGRLLEHGILLKGSAAWPETAWQTGPCRRPSTVSAAQAGQAPASV
jgi:hypothetical protein